MCPAGQTQADAGLVNAGCVLGQVVQILGVSYTCETFGGALGVGGICCCTGGALAQIEGICSNDRDVLLVKGAVHLHQSQKRQRTSYMLALAAARSIALHRSRETECRAGQSAILCIMFHAWIHLSN